MGTKYTEINDQQRAFIERQKIYFVGTAPEEGRINVSPKGLDTFRVLDANRVVWLNLTGSGNETAAHLIEDGRMTIMFCAFEGDALILRLYGDARAIHQRDDAWDELITLFPPLPGPRQIIDMHVDLVHASCGDGVPLYDYVGDRENLTDWLDGQDEDAIRAYWRRANAVSLDGKPTHILDE
jgi:hypothetical protein